MRAGRLSTDVRYARLISADRNRVNLPRLGRNLRRRCRRGCCRSCRRSSHGRRMRPRRIRSRRHTAWRRLVRRRLTANGRAHVGWRALALCDRNRGDHRRSRFRRLNCHRLFFARDQLLCRGGGRCTGLACVCTVIGLRLAGSERDARFVARFDDRRKRG
jgi:hypothetical protein